MWYCDWHFSNIFIGADVDWQKIKQYQIKCYGAALEALKVCTKFDTGVFLRFGNNENGADRKPLL